MGFAKTIGIIGVGMVGGAMQRYFQAQGIAQILYDPPKGFSSKDELAKADLVFVCVPTPYDPRGGGFDLQYVDSAFGALLRPTTVVIRSTVLPGTTRSFAEKYSSHAIMFNPEFLTESTADEDMRAPRRQIIGILKEEDRAHAEAALAVLPKAPFTKIVRAEEAEMLKYFGNSFYALKVAFANQIYDLCQKLGIEYDAVKECAAAEPWIGGQHLTVMHKGYRGYGGKCLPKDTRALLQLAQKAGVELSILRVAAGYNNALLGAQGISGDAEKPDLEKDR